MNEKDALFETKQKLQEGKVILFPADTIWGLSADATNAGAVEKVINLKGRTPEKSFIILINSDRMLNQCFKDIPEVVWDLVDLAESPLTVVLQNGQYVSKNVLNNDGSLGFRMVKRGSPFQLLSTFNKPIISTSPNFTGEPTPMSFDAISEELKQKVDFIYPLEFAKGLTNQPSKIISVGINGEVKILRK